MGKEAKIGLAVILILLITFGVVLARRLTGSDDASDKTSTEAKAKGTAGAKQAAGGKGQKSGPSPAARKGPTVVAAKNVSNKSKKAPQSAAGRSNAVSDRNRPGQPLRPGQAKLTPPFPMPRPPGQAAAAVGRQPGGGGQSALAAQNRAAGQRHDPFQTGPSQIAAGSAAHGFPPQISPGPGRSGLGARAVQRPAAGQTSLRVGVAQPGQNLGAGQPALGQRAGQLGAGGHGRNGLTWQGSAGSSVAQSPLYRQASRPADSNFSRLSPIPGRTSAADNFSGFPSPPASDQFRRQSGAYQVQPNDSYWVISERLYGTGAYFKALAEHNRHKVPREDQLEVGDVISAPDLAELEQTYPGLCPKASRREVLRNRATAVAGRRSYIGGRTYTVQEGDNLFDIARYELGKASRWPEIHQLNRDVLGDDYDLVTPGLELILPDDGRPADNVTQRPGAASIYQR